MNGSFIIRHPSRIRKSLNASGLGVVLVFIGFIACSLTSASAAVDRPSSPPDFTPPPLPAELDSSSRFAPGLDGDELVGPLVYVDESTDQIFRYLEELTGKMILQQESLPSPLLNFNSRGQLTRMEAVLAIESILTLNGISVTSMGEKFLKAVPTASIRYQSPDIITGSTLNQSTSQRHYSKIFHVKHLNLEEVTQIVNALQTPGLSTQLVLKKTNAVMVTDSLTNLQQIEKILNNVDVPSEMESEMIFRSLNYISALELKDRLDNMTQGPLKRFLDGETHFEADERTNQIVILTSPENVDVIERVISSLDVDAAPLTRTEVYYLKYADAKEVSPILDSLVSGQNSITNGPNSNANAGRGAGGATPGAAGGISSISANGEQVASDQFSPYITIESDERSNAIIVFGTSSDIRYVSGLIEKIDVSLPQVKIDVIIAEVNVGDKYARGIDSFGVNFDESRVFSDGIEQSKTSTNKISFGSNELIRTHGSVLRDFTLNAVFQTAQSDSDVSILSAPTLMTTHNKEAKIIAGEKRPVITGSSTDSTGSNTRSSVDLQDIGIELKFTPLIGSNGVVQLEIEQTIESVKGTTLIDGNEQPIVGTREAISYVSVADGEVIVLGGMQEVRVTKTEGRVFFFGQIPILGDWLFSRTIDNRVVQDLVIFIRPQVIYDTKEAKEASDRFIELNPQRDQVQSFLENDRFKDE